MFLAIKTYNIVWNNTIIYAIKKPLKYFRGFILFCLFVYYAPSACNFCLANAAGFDLGYFFSRS